MAAENEKRLRIWLKDAMGFDVLWVEPTLGSTVGMPDTVLKVYDSHVPVELKWCKKTKTRARPEITRWSVEIRPAQLRYHTMAHRRGSKTAIMIAMEVGSCFHVWLLPGKHCRSLHPVDPQIATMVATSQDRIEYCRDRICKVLSSKEFWR